MKKIILALTLSSLAFCSELEWGYGTIDMSGGFTGLNSTISSNISTYTMTEKHKNIFASNLFFGYNLTIFDSEEMKQMQKSYNNYNKSSNLNTIPNYGTKLNKLSTISHRFKGLDLGATLGYDLLHKGERNYLGIGLYGGVSLPQIQSSGSSKYTDITKHIIKNSNTDLLSYKIGAGVYAQKSLNKYISIYGSAIYAYQTGNIKNSFVKLDQSIDGKYLELNAGLKFQAVKADYDAGIISINPRLYGTIGWRYREWQINKANINLNNMHTSSGANGNMNISSHAATAGFGYSF